MVAWKNALEDAEIYLEKAEESFRDDPGRIVVTLGSLSLIRSADTLFQYFMGRVPIMGEKENI